MLICSDLHFEFHADGGRSFIKDMPLESADVVILAGDVGTLHGGGLVWALKQICARAKAVVMVCGNHEYYNSSPRLVHADLQAVCKAHPNFHWLNNSAVTLGDDEQRFVGTTLWFGQDIRAMAHKHQMNDFRVIRDFTPWVYDQNRDACNFLRQEVRSTDVVITHHLPSVKSIDPQFAGSPLNPFFCWDVEDVIVSKQPRLWVHGHTHGSSDYNIGDTRVVANPFGYAGHEENPAFKWGLLIDV